MVSSHYMLASAERDEIRGRTVRPGADCLPYGPRGPTVYDCPSRFFASRDDFWPRMEIKRMLTALIQKLTADS